MTKRQLIDEILEINPTAKAESLAPFEDEILHQYLERLRAARAPRLSGDPHRFDRYFAARVAAPANFGLRAQAVSTESDAAERAALLAAEPPHEREGAKAEDANAAAAATADDIERALPCGGETLTEAEGGEMFSEGGVAWTDPADEEPTTRRDSLCARTARPWRASGPLSDDDAEEPTLDAPQDGADESDAPPVEELEDQGEPEPSIEDDAPQPVAASPRSASRDDKQDDSQSWLL